MNRYERPMLIVKFGNPHRFEFQYPMTDRVRIEKFRKFSLADLMQAIYFELAASTDNFWQRLMTEDDKRFMESRSRKRRNIAATPDELLPDRDAPVPDWCMQLRNRLWILTNISSAECRKMLTMACKLADFEIVFTNNLSSGGQNSSNRRPFLSRARTALFPHISGQVGQQKAINNAPGTAP